MTGQPRQTYRFRWTDSCLTYLLMVSCLGVMSSSQAGDQIENLPESFYNRPGLEGLPRIEYESLPVVNIREEGAPADGSGNINQLLRGIIADLDERGGGVVYFPPGTYAFGPETEDKRIHYDVTGLSNIHLVGEGMQSVILFDLIDPHARLMRIRDCTNLSFRDLAFRVGPFYDVRGLEGSMLFTLNNNTNIQMLRLFSDQGYTAFWGGNRNVWAVDGDYRNSPADALKFVDTRDGVAAYNYIENVNEDSCTHMVKHEFVSERNRFVNNTVIGRAGQGRGVAFSGRDHVIAGNWIECIGNAGIYFHEIGWTGTRDLDAVSSGFEVRGNTLVRCHINGSAGNRILGHKLGGAMCIMHNQRNHVISNNNVYGAEQDGIVFAGHWLGVKAENIRLEGNTSAGNEHFGLSFQVRKPDDYVRDVTLLGNKIYDNRSGSIAFQGTVEDLELAGNWIEGEVAFPADQRDRYAPFLDNGGLSGTNRRDIAGGYTDTYLVPRTAPDEKGWIEPPVLEPTQPEINVRDAGAAGDGTTNDTAAFFDALAQLPETGGTIYVPAGDYRLDPLKHLDSLPYTRIAHHVLVRGRDNIHFRGDGQQSRLLFTSRDHQGLRLINCTNTSIRDLTFEFTDSLPIRFSRSLLDVSASENVEIADVRALNSCGTGIMVEACRAVNLHDCRVSASGEHGIRIDAGRQIFVSDCRVENVMDVGIYTTAYGGIARVPQYVRIEGNVVAGSRRGHGIAVAQGGNPLVIRRNAVRDAYQAGIGVYAVNRGFPDRDIEVSRNTLRRCGNKRFRLHKGAISVTGIGAHSRKEVPIKLAIHGNLVVETPWNGIWFHKNKRITHLQLRNNRFENIGGDHVLIPEDQRKTIENLVRN